MKEVLDKIKPDASEENRVNSIINEFLNKLNYKLKGAKAILGGSGAKDTWLKGVHDADIFVQFDYAKFKNRSSELSDILEKVLKKVFKKIDRLHGSRDYFQIKYEDFIFEIVPILKISKASDALNITDISPLHAKWVNKFPKLKDDMRLVKQFCKACGVYGAESYIQGFSGYIVEILTIKYGGFMKLVRAASKWGEEVVIDVAKHYRNKNQIMMDINKSKLVSPLILVDPVDKDRNAAAAIGVEQYNRFIDYCKKFVKKKSLDFFEVKEISVDDLKKDTKSKEELVILEVLSLKGKEDVIGSKLVKVFNFILQKSPDFKIIRKGWQWDKKKKALMWLYVDKKKLDLVEVRKGPRVKNEYHVKRFKKKYKKVFVKNGRVYAKVKREFRELKSFLRKLVKDEYVKERVKGIKVIS